MKKGFSTPFSSFFPGRFFSFFAFFNSLHSPGFSMKKPGPYFLLFLVLRAPAGLFQRRPARGQNHIPRPAAFGGRFALHASALALRGVTGLF